MIGAWMFPKCVQECVSQYYLASTDPPPPHLPQRPIPVQLIFSINLRYGSTYIPGLGITVIIAIWPDASLRGHNLL